MKTAEVTVRLEMSESFLEKIFSFVCDAEQNAERLQRIARDQYGNDPREYEKILSMYGSDLSNAEELREYLGKYRNF